MNLKSETPLIKKLEIKRLEDECENLRLWRWRLLQCGIRLLR